MKTNDYARFTSLLPLIGGEVNFCVHILGKPTKLLLLLNNSNQSLPKFTKSLLNMSLPHSLPILVSLKVRKQGYKGDKIEIPLRKNSGKSMDRTGESRRKRFLSIGNTVSIVSKG